MDEAFEAWWANANNGYQQGDNWEKDIARRAFEAGYYKCEQEHFP